MATLEELIERIREAAGDHPAFDKVDTAIGSSSVTTLELKLGEHSPVGTLIHTKKFETMLVTDKPSLRTHTVERGWNGTTKATSYAVGDIVFSGGRHSYHRYRRAVNEALGAITFAFGKPTWDSTQSFGSSKRIIEVPAAAIRMFDLATKPSGVTDLEPVAYRFLRSVPTAISSTGRGARLLSGNPGSGTAYIGYEVIWPTLTNLIDVLDAAYPADTEDLIEDGAVAWLEDAELFRRLAYGAPHARVDRALSTAGEIRIAAREALLRFIGRRSEVAARERIQNLGWLKR